MKATHLFDTVKILENPRYEQIIADLLHKKYSIVDDFFTREEIDPLRHNLLVKFEENSFKKAGIGDKTNALIRKEIRSDAIHWLNQDGDDPSEKQFFAKIDDWITYLNQTCFMGITTREFHYALYQKGTFYKRHLDTFQIDDRRKLSFVCYLNDENWQKENGGELVLYPKENGREVEKTVYPFPGRTVIFESQVLEHEVKPVLKSERLSITGWFKTH